MGLGGGAEAFLGPGPSPVSTLAWPDPPFERRTASRQRVRPVRSPRILISNNSAPGSDSEKSCLFPASFGNISALEEGFFLSLGHLSSDRPAED